MKKTVTVYCSHATDLEPHYYDMATAVGTALAKEGLALIYGGARNGLMGSVADAVLLQGGHVTGVVPNVVKLNEVTHQGLSELIQVDDMRERKRIMYDQTDAIIVLPGGFGTLDEVFEVLTRRKLELHDKKTYFFNHHGFWDSMNDMLEKFIEAKMIEPYARNFYDFAADVPQLMALLAKDPHIAV